MKTILTFFFILFIAIVAQAQETTNEVKVENVETTTVTSNTTTRFNEVSTQNNNEVARLYKFKNARVLKALAFTTKRNTAKLA
ncbi:hypothetical protein OO009_09830 [Flavobacteriaceae bacterium KMM 6897]|nr:hypothetical protein [Flavobacteriaceae bacterium KMM 6897]MEB8344605.1 hypothetical protein [Flavobacteriaceae bacterium KMM 6898]